jgi:23S rRNA pseudouridine955/2504/2580 synthase/23S rRNA pseudouridine1911/1915/1917 synthase
MRWRASRGEKLLTFLKAHCRGDLSVKAIKRIIDSKGCRVNGSIETVSTRLLQEGDTVEFLMSAPSKTTLPILYEDASFLICDKPPGVVCERKYLPALPVHRLDKETSGVLILAKSHKVLEAMIELFRKHAVQKEYLALVDGVVADTGGVITTLLIRKWQKGGEVGYGSAPQGQRAITKWRKIKSGPTATLLLCEPVTGRTHQIRVHWSELGHPILGDLRYGHHFRCSCPVRRHLLHAFRTRFAHPMTGEIVSVQAPLPDDFTDVLEATIPGRLVLP